MEHFAQVERYLGTLLDADLARLRSGEVAVVESARRLARIESYGYLHALWWLRMVDGRSVVSVAPGAGSAVASMVRGARADELLGVGLAERLRAPVDRALREHGLLPCHRVLQDLRFACDATHLRRHADGECRRLRDGSVLPAEGLRLPEHCFPDGLVYGVIVRSERGERVASVAYAHRTRLMEHQLADLGVETAPAHRRRGYARTAVSAVVAEIAASGGEALYSCSPNNQGSAATARSAGFVPLGVSLVLAAPAADV